MRIGTSRERGTSGKNKPFLLQLANAGIVHTGDPLDEIEFATDTGEDTSQEAT